MICVILPAYNEEKSLDNLLSKIDKTLKRYDYRIIVVNDGSKDKTREKLEFYQTQMPIEVINHKINRGLGETSRDMFERAAELCNPDDIIIRMDCDDTHEPKYMLDMLKKIDEGYDVVIASRFQPGGGQHGLNGYRKFISRCANVFMKVFFPIKGVWEYSCGYRAYRASIIQDVLKIYGNDFISLKGLGFTCTLEKLVVLRNIKARFAEVPFELHYEQKLSTSKMLSSITTLGYLVLALKYIYPWGPVEKERRKLAKLLYERRIYQENHNSEINGVVLGYVRHLRQA